VDDSPFMRKIISDLIAQDESFMIAGTATNGVEAIDQVKALTPDAITLDVEMPTMNGIVALQKIKEQYSTPVIMLSSLTEEGRQETISALENGAFDFVCKPSPSGGNQDIHQVGQMLHEKLHAAIQAEERRQVLHKLEQELKEKQALATETMSKRVAASREADAKRGSKVLKPEAKRSREALTSKYNSSKVKGPVEDNNRQDQSLKESKRILSNRSSSTIKEPSNKPEKRTLPLKKDHFQSAVSIEKPVPVEAPSYLVDRNKESRGTTFQDLVAIGTSTGGPRALKALLSELPGNLEAPVVIVQHMPPNFTRSLAQRLNSYSELEVKEAEDGDVLRAGCAYLAPGGQHMGIVRDHRGNYVIALNRDEPCSGHRPSVDKLFDSLLPLNKLERHLVLLTGMGSDGAKMMKKLYDHGVHSTFIESEHTCVVYGMPRAAMELGCVTHVAPIQSMAEQIVQAIHKD
ncbi:protein-glutamate methylesterase/protein-glutamine glutaminase, partial [Paenibacillus sp. 1001270B_150601_E10]|uniref:protein-glutamate methylesterase/protein-glutamine glutaminase n=1 Tax=Paenibacillus sp. 1001270B_150601_E10 TaxID=2787079 RepID=UPI00189CCAC3